MVDRCVGRLCECVHACMLAAVCGLWGRDDEADEEMGWWWDGGVYPLITVTIPVALPGGAVRCGVVAEPVRACVVQRVCTRCVRTRASTMHRREGKGRERRVGCMQFLVDE